MLTEPTVPNVRHLTKVKTKIAELTAYAHGTDRAKRSSFDQS